MSAYNKNCDPQKKVPQPIISNAVAKNNRDGSKVEAYICPVQNKAGKNPIDVIPPGPVANETRRQNN